MIRCFFLSGPLQNIAIANSPNFLNIRSVGGTHFMDAHTEERKMIVHIIAKVFFFFAAKVVVDLFELEWKDCLLWHILVLFPCFPFILFLSSNINLGHFPPSNKSNFLEFISIRWIQIENVFLKFLHFIVFFDLFCCCCLSALMLGCYPSTRWLMAIVLFVLWSFTWPNSIIMAI